MLLQTISQEELFAIYNVADVCMVTSVRDGMNLVSHEYVAAQSETNNHDAGSNSAPGDHIPNTANTALVRTHETM
jgi:trehalose-6-phosphate synthase